MPKPIAVIAADCHVEELLSRERPEIYGDAFHGFRQCVDKAIELSLPLILAGDVVETLPARTPTSKTIAFLSYELARMQAAQLPVYAIYGQHDRADPSWLKACSNWVTDANNAYYEIGGRKFYFLSYRVKDKIQQAIENIEIGTDVLIAHQAWKELMGGVGYDCSIGSLNNVSTVISGDYHRVVKAKGLGADGQEITIFSPGATHMRKMREPTTHICGVLNDDLSMTSVRLSSRVVLSLTISTDDELHDAIANWSGTIEGARARVTELALPPELHKPYLILTDSTADRSGYTKLVETVGNDVHLFVTAEPRKSSIDGNINAFVSHDSIDLLAFLEDEVPSDSDEYAVLSKLLKLDPSRTIASVLSDIRQDHMRA